MGRDNGGRLMNAWLDLCFGIFFILAGIALVMFGVCGLKMFGVI